MAAGARTLELSITEYACMDSTGELEAPAKVEVDSLDSLPVDTLSRHLEELFDVRQRGSTVAREIRAGLVTWVTMSYIVVVNPMILSASSAATLQSGEPDNIPISFQAACRATCISAAAATLFVGLTANLPLGLAPGMGLNSFFRYGMVGRLGLGAEAAFGCCFVQAVVFAGLALSGLADKLQDILPAALKSAITVAIGVFQAFVGFQMMGLVVKSETTLVALGDFDMPSLWLALAGILLVAALLMRQTKGALLLGICFTTVAWQILDLPNINASTSSASGPEVAGGVGAKLNQWGIIDLDFSAASSVPHTYGNALATMLFIVLFDTAGVQFGLCQQAGLLDRRGRVPGAKWAYLASSVGTSLGALLGTSPVIIHNESAAGVSEGGRTGLCALTTATLFLLSPLLVPVIELIPPEATAPCLVLVGTMMMTPVKDIDFTDLHIALPAFLIICVTPLTYSISAGILVGVASYFILRLVSWLTEAAEKAGEAFGQALWGTGTSSRTVSLNGKGFEQDREIPELSSS
eukprot:TRINITY_DN43153_c0_g1_i1.p1 TRINITY_DN43153_c0_g1~~TRINITY_DN43153_c0_g1_i1.p1  ORF type:complete len:523 (-),score=111.40 TRINITY_DN43153_c0_g1_i1:174-1742(-)